MTKIDRLSFAAYACFTLALIIAGLTIYANAVPEEPKREASAHYLQMDSSGDAHPLLVFSPSTLPFPGYPTAGEPLPAVLSPHKLEVYLSADVPEHIGYGTIITTNFYYDFISDGPPVPELLFPIGSVRLGGSGTVDTWTFDNRTNVLTINLP